MKKSLSRRITAYFLIIMLLTMVLSVSWNFFSTRGAILRMEKSQAEGCMEVVLSLMDHYGEALEKDRDSPGYTYLWNAIHNFCKGFSQDAIYLYTLDPGKDSRQMLMEVEAGAEWEETAQVTPYTFSVPDVQLSQAEKALLSGGERLRRAEWEREDKRIAVWLARLSEVRTVGPVFLAMEYSIERETAHIIGDFYADIFTPNLALLAASIVMIAMVRKRVAAPIRAISQSMRQFAQNGSVRPEPLRIKTEDEIGEIAASFEAMTQEITSYIGNIEKLTKERLELHVQMDVARRIQYGLVPERTAIGGEGFRICAMTRPAKAVGGDFYDCFRMADGTVCALIGDVSGKGITGAIFMAVTKTMIRDRLMLGLSPAQALNRTNDQLIGQNPEGLFATVFVAALDPRTGEVRYANAGHTPPVLLGRDRFLEMETGIALGLFEDAGIVDETMKLECGEGLLLYTDGVTDALNAARVRFGEERLLRSIREAQGPDAAEAVLTRVSRDVGRYCEGVEPFDDMAALALYRTEQPDMQTLPVSLSSFAAIKENVFDRAGNTPETRKALLACDEALANIVHHSGAGLLLFACRLQGNVLEVTFSDDGIPFDPTASAQADKPFEELDSGGMGLTLILETASLVRYERRDDRNVFTLGFPV